MEEINYQETLGHDWGCVSICYFFDIEFSGLRRAMSTAIQTTRMRISVFAMSTTVT